VLYSAGTIHTELDLGPELDVKETEIALGPPPIVTTSAAQCVRYWEHVASTRVLFYTQLFNPGIMASTPSEHKINV
jgi:hypothetical protein